MVWDPLNPGLNLLLWHLILALNPSFLEFFFTCNWTVLCSLSFHPILGWFNSIEIRRVARPEESHNPIKIKELLLFFMSVSRSIVFLNSCLWTILFTLLSKR
jgi:hypothetical protein